MKINISFKKLITSIALGIVEEQYLISKLSTCVDDGTNDFCNGWSAQVFL